MQAKPARMRSTSGRLKAYSSRRAAAIGSLAARIAGKRPPIKPMVTAQSTPPISKGGVTRNAKAIWRLALDHMWFRHFERALQYQQRMIELRPADVALHVDFHRIEYLRTGDWASYDNWRSRLPADASRPLKLNVPTTSTGRGHVHVGGRYPSIWSTAILADDGQPLVTP